jgi:periplasmic protein TonB
MKKQIFILPLILLVLTTINVFGQKKDTSEKSSNKYLVKAEVMPEPVGGISAIQKRVVYPEIARRAGIEGKVYVQALIDENGDVVKTKILKGIGSGCDESAMKAVKETKFTPAKQEDRLVKVQVVVPVLFKLNKSKIKNSQ